MLLKLIKSSVALLFLTLPACIKRDSAKAELNARIIRWATATPLESGDWTECQSNACKRHASLVMEGLLRIEMNNGRPTWLPALAEKIEAVSPREIRIELRKGIHWSDGLDLQAKHFVESWRRVLSRCKTLPTARRLFPIANAQAYCRKQVAFEKVGIQIHSPLTLSLHLHRPTPFFTRLFAHPVTWPRRLDASPDTPPTLGPFTITPNRPLSFRRNPLYHGSAVKTDALEFVVIPSFLERLELFREGSVDLAEDLEGAFPAQVANDPAWHLFPTEQRIYLVLDLNRKPLHSPKLRQALCQAVQREEAQSLVHFPVIPAESLFSQLPAARIPYDPQVSRQLVQGEALEMAPLKITWQSGEPLREIAMNLKAQWAKNLGIEVQVCPPTPRNRKAHLEIRTWREDLFAPGLPGFIPSGPVFFADVADAQAHWEKVQKQWVERQYLVLPLFQRARAVLKSPKVSKLTANPIGVWSFGALEIIDAR